MEVSTKVLSTHHKWQKAFEDQDFVGSLTTDVLPAYLQKCRWFAAKASKIKQYRLENQIKIKGTGTEGLVYLLILEVIFAAGNSESYLVPVYFAPVKPSAVEEAAFITKAKVNGQNGVLMEATYLESYRNRLFKNISSRAQIKDDEGEVVFNRGRVLTRDKTIKRISSSLLGAEQSNTTIVYNDKYFLKVYRRLFIDPNPDYELTQFLSEGAGFKYSPQFAGSIHWKNKKLPEVTLGLMQYKVENQGEAWGYLLQQVRSFFQKIDEVKTLVNEIEEVPLNKPRSIKDLSETLTDLIGYDTLEKISKLGKRTAQMHISLASDKNNRAFAPILFNEDYSVWLKNRLMIQFDFRYNLVELNLHKLQGLAYDYALKFLDNKQFIQRTIIGLDIIKLSSQRIRIHGDYHLGQVLITDGDFCILDFEGEPECTIRDRKVKQSPLKDVAGMFRSFHYAVYATIFDKGSKSKLNLEDQFTAGEKYYQAIISVYLNSYIKTAMDNALDIGYMPEINYLLRYHLLEKAIYELGYELNSRPAWVIIPLKGIMQILETEKK